MKGYDQIKENRSFSPWGWMVPILKMRRFSCLLRALPDYITQLQSILRTEHRRKSELKWKSNINMRSRPLASIGHERCAQRVARLCVIRPASYPAHIVCYAAAWNAREWDHYDERYECAASAGQGIRIAKLIPWVIVFLNQCTNIRIKFSHLHANTCMQNRD